MAKIEAESVKEAKKTAEGQVRDLVERVQPLERKLIKEITDPAQVPLATSQFQQLKVIEKDLNGKKRSILDPLNTAVKAVRDLFRPAEQRLTAAIDEVRNALDSYSREVKAELAEREAVLEEKVENGKLKESTAIRKLERETAATQVYVIPVRKIKKVQIDDESKIPDAFWIIDHVALRAALIAGQKVPGAQLIEEEIVVSG
jgi:hypothetical protein